jgi:outer membrane protein TolC
VRNAIALAFCAAPFLAAAAQAAPPSLGTVSPAPASPAPSGLVVPSVPLIEPGYRAPAAGVPSGDIVGVAQAPFVGISLQDVVGMALAKNTDLIVSQTNRRVAGYQIVAAQGAYDLRFQVVPSYQYAKSPPLSPFQAGPLGGAITQTQAGVGTSLSGQLEGGTRYSIGASGQGTSTNSTSAGFTPSYATALSFNITQPLARGSTFDDARRQLALARANADASTDSTLLTASTTIWNAQNAYWDLVAAWRNVAIQEEALRAAKAQSDSNERLVRRGAAASVDVVESNVQVETFQDDVFSALASVSRLQNQLKALTLSDPADPIWTANLVPTSSALDLPAEPALNDVIISALRNRPEIGALREQRRAADANLAYARDQARPQIDLSLGYTSNGFAGTPVPLSDNAFFAALGPQIAATQALIAFANARGANIPPLRTAFPATPSYLIGGIGQSVTNLLDNRFPMIGISATIGLPLRNRTARANVAVAVEQQRSLDAQQVGLIQRLTIEARNALQGVRSAKSRLVAASAARGAAERVYESERRKFRAGTSTTFLVLQRATNLATQRGRELQAQTDLNKAVVELDRVSGTILAKNGVDLSSAGTTQPPATSLPVRESPPPGVQLPPLP